MPSLFDVWSAGAECGQWAHEDHVLRTVVLWGGCRFVEWYIGGWCFGGEPARKMVAGLEVITLAHAIPFSRTPLPHPPLELLSHLGHCRISMVDVGPDLPPPSGGYFDGVHS